MGYLNKYVKRNIDGKRLLEVERNKGASQPTRPINRECRHSGTYPGRYPATLKPPEMTKQHPLNENERLPMGWICGSGISSQAVPVLFKADGRNGMDASGRVVHNSVKPLPEVSR